MGFPRQEYWSELPFPPPGDQKPYHYLMRNYWRKRYHFYNWINVAVGPCIFFIVKMITNLKTNCPLWISPDGSREGRGWRIGKRSRGVIRRKEWTCLTEQITFSSQCWGLSNISMWKNMLFVCADHPGKKQDTPSRIYLWLNQSHLKGIVFQTVLLMQEGLHSSDHPEIRSKVV